MACRSASVRTLVYDSLLQSYRSARQEAPRCLRLSSHTQQRAFSVVKRRNEKKQERDSFHGQLLRSTAERVQRERLEHARYAEMPSNRYEGDPGRGAADHRYASLAWSIAVLVSAFAGYRFGYNDNREISPASTLPLSSVENPKLDASEHSLQAAWVDIRAVVGAEQVSTDKDDRLAHAGSDWSTYAEQESEVPFMVVRPGTTEEVSEIMRICHRRRIPVTPYSGGTSLEGHFASTGGGICIDFSRMDQILKLDKEDLDVIVQPAVGWERLNDYLAEHNLFFPPDPGPGAMIGGMIGTGCSGTNSFRYGTMRDWVMSLTVVLADGTVIKTKQRPRKSAAGYDLTRLFVGSEGTLGLVTEATLKVTPKPINTSVAVCTFPSVRHAADCAFRIVGTGVPLAAVEILDDVQMRCINDADLTQKKWREAATLFFKFAGTPAAVKEQISIAQNVAKKAGSETFEFAKNKEQAEELWSARKEALWSVLAKRRQGERVWTTDVAVPISRLAECIEQTKNDLVKSGLLGTIVGHVGDGNFHAIILYDERDERDIVEDVVHRMVKRALAMEGTATGEHGVGIVKRDYLPHEIGQPAIDLMRKMKQAFDPLCLLNCDKVVRMHQPKAGEIKPW